MRHSPNMVRRLAPRVGRYRLDIAVWLSSLNRTSTLSFGTIGAVDSAVLFRFLCYFSCRSCLDQRSSSPANLLASAEDASPGDTAAASASRRVSPILRIASFGMETSNQSDSGPPLCGSGFGIGADSKIACNTRASSGKERETICRICSSSARRNDVGLLVIRLYRSLFTSYTERLG